MRQPYSLTDCDLKDYAEEHLQYEYEMLVYSTIILGYLSSRSPQEFISLAIHNGLLNTFALHARNLINFIYSCDRNADFPTDIIIQDYIEPSTISSLLPPISKLLKDALKKCAKQAAHLTKDRIDYESSGKEWRFVKITQEIIEILSDLASSIPDSKISPSLKNKFVQGTFTIPDINIQTIYDGSQPTGISLKLIP